MYRTKEETSQYRIKIRFISDFNNWFGNIRIPLFESFQSKQNNYKGMTFRMFMPSIHVHVGVRVSFLMFVLFSPKYRHLCSLTIGLSVCGLSDVHI
jgi:hypothetical protein